MSTIVSDTTQTAPDGSTIETITYSDGSRSIQYTPAALTANATYLAIASPSNAQVSAQVTALTKETTAVIRLLLGQFDSTSGT